MSLFHHSFRGFRGWKWWLAGVLFKRDYQRGLVSMQGLGHTEGLRGEGRAEVGEQLVVARGHCSTFP